MKYYGKLIIGETNCTFEQKDYTLTIFPESDVFLGWKNLNSILDDKTGYTSMIMTTITYI